MTIVIKYTMTIKIQINSTQQHVLNKITYSYQVDMSRNVFGYNKLVGPFISRTQIAFDTRSFVLRLRITLLSLGYQPIRCYATDHTEFCLVATTVFSNH
jgi:hypothetical protein